MSAGPETTAANTAADGTGVGTNGASGWKPETVENDMVNPGGGDPAATLPPRRNYTVSQVPLPPYMKLANPGPLGLLSFAITTFVLGLYQCGAGYVANQ